MKNRIGRGQTVLVTCLLLLPMGAAAGRSSQIAQTSFTGEVTDTICAKSGSHAEMMAKMQSMGRDKETCTKKCAEVGAKYALYDEGTKNVYQLDDQAKAQQFAGRRVHVSGTVEGNQIKVTDMEAIG